MSASIADGAPASFFGGQTLDEEMLAMERRNWLVILAALTILPLTGCGNSDKPAPGSTPGSISATTPDKAVFQFLEAVRVGNDATAGQMLTKLAREKTAEMQLVVAPPGSETAKFSVGEVEFLGESGGTWRAPGPTLLRMASRIPTPLSGFSAKSRKAGGSPGWARSFSTIPRRCC